MLPIKGSNQKAKPESIVRAGDFGEILVGVSCNLAFYLFCKKRLFSIAKFYHL